MYTRILKILRGYDSAELSDADRERIADEVRAEVEKVVSAVPRPVREGGVPFLTFNGVAPRDVTPMPVFNNQYIQMTEGYVDVETLPLAGEPPDRAPRCRVQEHQRA